MHADTLETSSLHIFYAKDTKTVQSITLMYNSMMSLTFSKFSASFKLKNSTQACRTRVTLVL